MICKNENCKIEYNIPYGYGEFCSSRCAAMKNQPPKPEKNPPQIKPKDNNIDK